MTSCLVPLPLLCIRNPIPNVSFEWDIGRIPHHSKIVLDDKRHPTTPFLMHSKSNLNVPPSVRNSRWLDENDHAPTYATHAFDIEFWMSHLMWETRSTGWEKSRADIYSSCVRNPFWMSHLSGISRADTLSLQDEAWWHTPSFHSLPLSSIPKRQLALSVKWRRELASIPRRMSRASR